MINVFIIDDQEIIREGLKMMLSLYDTEIRIIGEAKNGKEGLNLISSIKDSIDIVLTDIKMPVLDGVAFTKIAKELFPQIKVIVLTTFNEDEYILNSLKNGAYGFLLKDSKSDELISAIKSVNKGNLLLTGNVANKLPTLLLHSKETDNKVILNQDNLIDKLTNREVDIASLVSRGLSNKEISSQLFLTEGTVKNYVTKILDKLNLKSRVELTLFFQENKNF